MNDDTAKLLIALHVDDQELCGFVLRDGNIHIIENVAAEPQRNFTFSTQGLFDFLAEYEPDEVEGMFHTHPSGSKKPSADDVRGWPRLPIRYYIVTADGVHEWSKDEFGVVSPVSGSALADRICQDTEGC